MLERRYVTTSPNRDEETGGFSSASAATGVGEGVDEEAGAPLLGKSRKDASISTTGGDSCGETSGGGMTVSTPGGGHLRDKETPCQSASQLNNAAHCSSFGVAASGALAPPIIRVPNEDVCTLPRCGDTGTTGLIHAGTASAHGDAVATLGDEKAGMFNDKQTQREKSFADESGIGADLGFTGARPHERHSGDLFNADAGATVSGKRHNSGTCATGVAGAVRGHTPAQETTPGAPGTHGGGNRVCGASKEDAATIGTAAGTTGPARHEGGDTISGDASVGVSYGVPDGGFTPIVYVDYNHQRQDWFEVYGPDYTDDEGELLPEIAAAAWHSIPAGGGVVLVSPGSFLQVIDVVKWWLGMDGNVGTSALGALRRSMKGNSALVD